MDADIPALTATPHAREPLAAFNADLDHAIAAVRAAHLMTQLAARGPRLRWEVASTTLVGRPEPDASEDQAAEAIREWASRLGLQLAGDTARGTVEGVEVHLLYGRVEP